MRSMSLALLCCWTPAMLADDKARVMVENAIKAHGGEVADAKLQTMRFKDEGTMELIPGQPAVPVTIEDIWQMPDKYRSDIVITFMGQVGTHTSVIDGDRGWSTKKSEVEDMAKEAVAEMREQIYAADLDRLGFLNDKDVDLLFLGESRIAGKPGTGVRVKSKGHRDVKLYFDSATSLLVRREHQVRDPAGGEEITQAVEFADHEVTAGVKFYKTLAVHRGDRQFMAVKV